MLSGKDLILATKEFAKEDRYKSWLYTLTSFFFLMFFFVFSYWNYNIYLRLICSIGAFLLFSRTFVIYHDYLHHTILQKSLLAKLLFKLFGLFALSPTSIWKRSHDYHHKNNSKLFTANIGSYPIMTKEQFISSSSKERQSYLLTRHPLTILFGYFSIFIYGMCIKSIINKPKLHLDSMLALLLHCTFGFLLVYFGGWLSLFTTLLIPYFLTFGFGAYLFYAQHNFPNVVFNKKESWSYEEAALQSSSYMKMSPLMRWVTGNIGYHHIHHINSRIPFYNLPFVMNHFAELQNVKVTTLKIKDILSCLKLKVWDSDKNKMLTKKELVAILQQEKYKNAILSNSY